MYATSMRNHLQPSLCVHFLSSVAFEGMCHSEELFKKKKDYAFLTGSLRAGCESLPNGEREVLRSPCMRLEGSKIKFLQAI